MRERRLHVWLYRSWVRARTPARQPVWRPALPSGDSFIAQHRYQGLQVRKIRTARNRECYNFPYCRDWTTAIEREYHPAGIRLWRVARMKPGAATQTIHLRTGGRDENT